MWTAGSVEPDDKWMMVTMLGWWPCGHHPNMVTIIHLSAAPNRLVGYPLLCYPPLCYPPLCLAQPCGTHPCVLPTLVSCPPLCYPTLCTRTCVFRPYFTRATVFAPNRDGVHTSYLNEGHCSTDKRFWMLIIMYTNGFNSISVMAGLKKRKINQKIKKNQRVWFFWLFDY